jgi:HlyD family secretion protein
LFRQGEGWAVFVVREGRAWLQPVELGPQDERFRIVRAGLAEGDRVVLFPTSGVRDGVRLTLP